MRLLEEEEMEIQSGKEEGDSGNGAFDSIIMAA